MNFQYFRMKLNYISKFLKKPNQIFCKINFFKSCNSFPKFSKKVNFLDFKEIGLCIKIFFKSLRTFEKLNFKNFSHNQSKFKKNEFSK